MKTEQKVEEKEEEYEAAKISWHQSIRVSLSQKTSSINQSLESKFPKIHSKTSSAIFYIKDVWQETFPNEEAKIKTKIARRREIAR